MDLLIRGFARGSFRIERGSWADYRALEHFHYINRRPAVPIGVWRIRFRPPGTRRRILAAVGVASFPTIRSRARECAIGLPSTAALRAVTISSSTVENPIVQSLVDVGQVFFVALREQRRPLGIDCHEVDPIARRRLLDRLEGPDTRRRDRRGR